MKGDFTRNTFNPRKHYRGVLMQQGRVQLDADWNENLDILLNRIETETIDVIGYCGVPIHDAGFGVLTTMIRPYRRRFWALERAGIRGWYPGGERRRCGLQPAAV